MGFSIYVADFVMYQAQCSEFECGWRGEITGNRSRAERERDDHYAYHQEKWRKQNEKWDRG